MGILSLSWFKSEKQKDLEALKVEEQRIKNETLVLQKQIMYDREYHPVVVPQEIPQKEDILDRIDKPYSKIKLVNSVLTIILHDGNILSKPNATQNDFQSARNSTTEEELFKIASNSDEQFLVEKKRVEEETKKVEALLKGVDVLKATNEFDVVDNTVYMKGVKRSIPQLLVEKFAVLVNEASAIPFDETEEYKALKKFWLKCCLNPNAQSAEDLYGFLSAHQFKIDKHGNFYAYRRVVSKGSDNKALVEFVSNTYNKVKAIWKKKPSNFMVVEDEGTYKIEQANGGGNHKGLVIGSLEELYLNLPNMQEKSYTSAHTGREDYRVGSIISMPRDEGNDDNRVSCSKGFHAASKQYNYSGFGDTPVLVIINPMDVLAVA